MPRWIREGRGTSAAPLAFNSTDRRSASRSAPPRLSSRRLQRRARKPVPPQAGFALIDNWRFRHRGRRQRHREPRHPADRSNEDLHPEPVDALVWPSTRCVSVRMMAPVEALNCRLHVTAASFSRALASLFLRRMVFVYDGPGGLFTLATHSVAARAGTSGSERGYASGEFRSETCPDASIAGVLRASDLWLTHRSALRDRKPSGKPLDVAGALRCVNQRSEARRTPAMLARRQFSLRNSPDA